ncbi:MAG: long-chain fatty acid--CoA ligase [Burkholderiaceae bacterium]
MTAAATGAEPLHFNHWPPGIPHRLDLPATSLWYNLEVTATRFPDRAAIVFYDSVLTYGELRDQAEAIAGWLQQHVGVKRGDRVLLDFQNSPQFVAGYYAILRADAFVVPVNPMLKTNELRHYVDDSGARVLLCAQDNWPYFAPLMNGAPEGLATLEHALVGAYSDAITAETDLAIPDFVRAPMTVEADDRVSRWTDVVAAARVPAPALAGPDDWCVMPYTSGTTGKPKGCVHTHRSVMHVMYFGARWAGVNTDTVALGVVPMFHVTGMQAMNSLIFAGGCNVVLPRWDRNLAAEAIARNRVTNWTCIPTMVIDLFANPRIDEYDLSSLNFMSGGGAAMPEAVAQKVKDLWGLDFVEGYGLSETIAASHTNPPHRAKKQCLGVPISDTDSRIIDPDTLVEQPQGATGEIITHGPGVFQGYWNDPTKTEAAFIQHDGKTFFRTGDLGLIDEDGYFFMVDRLKRMINASGFKVWPAEVEAMLYRNPLVQEACIIGTFDAYRGETVKALIVARGGANGPESADAIIAWARDHMAAYKVPRIIEFVDALPKSGTGKVMWRTLQEAENAKTAEKNAA